MTTPRQQSRGRGAEWRDVPSAPEWGERGLSSAERRIARAAAEALLCHRDDAGALVLPDVDWRDAVIDDFDLALGNGSVQLRLGMGAILRAVEWLAPVVRGGLAPMSRRSLDERVAYLEALEGHRRGMLTMLLVALKVPLTLTAFERGEPLRATGFDRPTTASRRRLAVVDGPGDAAVDARPEGEP